MMLEEPERIVYFRPLALEHDTQGVTYLKIVDQIFALGLGI